MWKVTPLQTSVVDDTVEAFNQAIVDAIDYLPTIVGALVILLIGYIIGRILGGIVTRIVRRIGLGRYLAESTDDEAARSDSIARALGKIVAYYVYFVALVAAAGILEITALSDLLQDLAEFLPVILGALIVLILGFIVARIIGDLVGGIVGGFGVGSLLRETPLEPLADETGEFGRIIGTLVTYYVYLLTLLAVADILEIDTLSELLNTFSGYLPALVGGLVVLVVGIWIAERVGDLVIESDDSRVAHVAGLVVKVLIYYLTITIALGTIGFNTAVLTSVFTAFTVTFFGAIGLALAIGIGIALGFGGRDYVSENIDRWMAELRGAVTKDEPVASRDSVSEDDEFEEL